MSLLPRGPMVALGWAPLALGILIRDAEDVLEGAVDAAVAAGGDLVIRNADEGVVLEALAQTEAEVSMEAITDWPIKVAIPKLGKDGKPEIYKETPYQYESVTFDPDVWAKMIKAMDDKLKQ
jgi:hypothetical protein